MATDSILSDPTLVSTPSTRGSVNGGHAKPRKGLEDGDDSSDALPDLEKGLPSDNTPNPPPEQKNSHLVEFNGPNDPDSPKSWTPRRRWAITCAMGSLVFTVTFASSIFSVNISLIEQKFGVDLATATLGVALFVLVCLVLIRAGVKHYETNPH